MTFQIDIEQYSGPIELLLHIVRREELTLADIPLATITDQYLLYLEVLSELNVDDVADFLDIASLLVEMKSKQSVPSTEEVVGEEEGVIDTSPGELVSRLIEYKRIRDAASILDEQGQRWQLRYARLANDLPARKTEIGHQAIEPIEVWDLVSAFGRILRERTPPATSNVVYDDTPIHVHMERIHGLVVEHGQLELTSLFEAGMHKSSLVAMFLATLELTRHYGLTTDQRDTGHPLMLIAGENFKAELDVHKIDNLSFDKVANSNMPVAPR
ncbi:segregation and condensation protein A [Aureliella helgolandensis]|uniref:Segregation and condensation protein A n=1 Tax=Aureliella helgolandensis TaxID=2527968 RepID=A0A518G5X3_9BACT|nr:segregation/condensation protein A [Aureliella helgolandensis]QDV23992.1 Segregation and condensation protein A [Aureliella helgolandensis]